ncbi:MAG: hypothetical protein ABW061_28905 [Polyangiaceae bacterium]
MPLFEATSLAASLGGSGGPQVLYATQPNENVLSLRWTFDASYDADWQWWSCFDLVPQAQRSAAANLSDFSPEVYATSKAGALFVRHFYSDGWAPWEPHPLPNADSHADDVAAVGWPSPVLFLYVIDRGRVFVRHRANSNSLSQYRPWVEVRGPAGLRRIAALLRLDGKQQIFVTNEARQVFSAVQTESGLDAAFTEFTPFGGASAPTLDEITGGYLKDGSGVLFGLSAGVVWSRVVNADSAGSWVPDAQGNAPSLSTLVVGSWPGHQDPVIFGTDSLFMPQLWHHQMGSSAWSQIP